MSARARRGVQPPLLATVTALPQVSLNEKAADIMHTLAAVGIRATPEQSFTLAEHGMRGLGCWTTSARRADLEAMEDMHVVLGATLQARKAATERARQEGTS